MFNLLALYTYTPSYGHMQSPHVLTSYTDAKHMEMYLLTLILTLVLTRVLHYTFLHSVFAFICLTQWCTIMHFKTTFMYDANVALGSVYI